MAGRERQHETERADDHRSKRHNTQPEGADHTGREESDAQSDFAMWWSVERVRGEQEGQHDRAPGERQQGEANQGASDAEPRRRGHNGRRVGRRVAIGADGHIAGHSDPPLYRCGTLFLGYRHSSLLVASEGFDAMGQRMAVFFALRPFFGECLW